MIEKIVLLSGPISCGKSTLAEQLASRLDMHILKTRILLGQRVGASLSRDRKALQAEGERLDKTTRGAWVLEELLKWLQEHPGISNVVIDSVRILGQIETLRKAFGSKVVHVHLTAPQQELEKRYKRRHRLGKESTRTYTEARDDPTEQQVESLASTADVVIDTKRCISEDVLVRVTSHLNVRQVDRRGYVDILIGGQYGSEGKGNVVAYLSPEYDILVRVGGPNAGHKVYEEPEAYTHHQLPAGTRRSQARLLIGPGATIRVDKLLKEIAECDVEAERLCIDANTMIISDDDIEAEEQGIKAIGSTGQGVGTAMARRIMGRFDSHSPLLARDIPELQPYLCSIADILDEAYSNGNRILLEGTQGTGLSLYHGFYPHVTSRDTTVTGCLAEVGIAWNKVRRVIMVCRTYPIRVQNPPNGTSGHMSQEINWSEISRRSTISRDALLKSEITSTTHKQRRVGEFDWGLLRKSAILNGPTDIALTFTDYLSEKNRHAKRFDQLHQDTINFIQEIEQVTGAHVSLISTGFNYRSIIDRRRW
jgi:adenylosuccinate synthase